MFCGTVEDITNLILEVCCKDNSTTGRTETNDFEAFIYPNKRAAICKVTYDKLHNTNVFGVNPPTPPVDHKANTPRDLLIVISAGNNNNMNNNITVPPSTPPTRTASATVVTPGGVATMGI